MNTPITTRDRLESIQRMVEELLQHADADLEHADVQALVEMADNGIDDALEIVSGE